MKPAHYHIDKVYEAEYAEVVELWEASVRATHTFLDEAAIAYYKPLMLREYLKAVELRCVRNDHQKIVGFLGVGEKKIEMLFIHPDVRGHGIGKMLLKHACQEMDATSVDVNEDNQQAVGFYEYQGFRTVARSALDAMGKPYPILHMELPK
ncbi:histone acetyltransferase HPA2-like acetyltransferase [Flammeovirgaceae bacterium 311]|nr:histone acetyltransferase HPA2-like acetyltransferase [Flammeovirgaceae bacterium 311]